MPRQKKTDRPPKRSAGRPDKAAQLVILQRRQRVMQCLIDGVKQEDIAQRENVDEAQITRDLAWCKAHLAASCDGKTAEFEGLALARIAAQQQRYLGGWERSCQPKKKTSTKKITGGDRAGQITAGITEELARDGNFRFLNGIDHCIEEFCKIKGLYKPLKIAPTTPDGQDGYTAGYEPDEVAAILERVAAILGVDVAGPGEPAAAQPV